MTSGDDPQESGQIWHRVTECQCEQCEEDRNTEARQKAAERKEECNEGRRQNVL